MKGYNKKIFIAIQSFLLILLFGGCIENGALYPDKNSVKEIMQKVTDWQIENFTYSETGNPGYLHDHGIDAWTNAVLYLGISEWAKIADNSKDYYDWLYDIGTKTEWTLPDNFLNHPNYGLYHADEFCMGQFFLKMSEVFKDEKMMTPTMNRLDMIISNPPDPEVTKGKMWWSWCDALFMAPPVYTRMSLITGDDKYLEFMDREFKRTYNYLYDSDEKLFYRDSNYFDKREENGQKIFWGRGNGWVAAGTAEILKYLPSDSPYRLFYEDLLKEHLARLIELSDNDGYWHASLLDPESYPASETSATALITYAMAYGINQGMLSKEEYLPHLVKSWNALTQMVEENGKLNWVQPIGADPRKVTKDMTAVYGVGAFLLAGTEVYKLSK